MTRITVWREANVCTKSLEGRKIKKFNGMYPIRPCMCNKRDAWPARCAHVNLVTMKEDLCVIEGIDKPFITLNDVGVRFQRRPDFLQV